MVFGKTKKIVPVGIIEEKKTEVVPKSEEEPKEEWAVVKELPVQPVRQTTMEDGTIINFITVEEALSQLVNQ